MDKTRQSFSNVTEVTRKIYEARIDFISCYMCLKVKTLVNKYYTPWTIYSMWAPGYDEAKPVSKPIAQPMLMPIIVAKIIPFEGSNTVPHADRNSIGNGYREKPDPYIQNKCVYGLWMTEAPSSLWASSSAAAETLRL